MQELLLLSEVAIRQYKKYNKGADVGCATSYD